MLLCDSAQGVGGKLYVLGGGWTQVVLSEDGVVAMALAIRVRVPWDRANQRIDVRAVLVNGEGEPVANEASEPIGAEGQIEVGRPTGLEAGTPLDAVLAINFPGIRLEPGTYVWNFEVDGDIKARADFRARTP